MLEPGRGVLPGAAARGVRPRFLVPLGVRDDERGLRVPFGVREPDFLRLVPLGVREPERCLREPRGVREPERDLVDRPRGVDGRGVFPPLRLPRGVRGVLPVRPGAAGVDRDRCCAFPLGRWCELLGLLEQAHTPDVQY